MRYVLKTLQSILAFIVALLLSPIYLLVLLLDLLVEAIKTPWEDNE